LCGPNFPPKALSGNPWSFPRAHPGGKTLQLGSGRAPWPPRARASFFLLRHPIPQPVAQIPNSPLASPVAAPVVPPVEKSSLTPRPSPTEEAMANGGLVLNQAELEVPNMQLAGNSTVDASLRDNLRTVNEFIAECQQHLKQHPGDLLAREYLESAYQQKAELLAAMMDSGRSEH